MLQRHPLSIFRLLLFLSACVRVCLPACLSTCSPLCACVRAAHRRKGEVEVCVTVLPTLGASERGSLGVRSGVWRGCGHPSLSGCHHVRAGLTSLLGTDYSLISVPFTNPHTLHPHTNKLSTHTSSLCIFTHSKHSLPVPLKHLRPLL